MSQGSLTSLKKVKEPPLRGGQYSIKERAGEVSGLEKQRDDLSKEIKRLGRIYFRLNEGIEIAKSTADEITSERLKTIGYIAREVSSDLEREASVLRDKSEQLDKHDLFLSELLEYLGSYAKIVEAKAALNARKKVFLKKRYRDILNVEERLFKLDLKSKERLKRAKRVEGTIDAKYEKVDEIAGWFEREADKEKHRLTAWAKTLKLREKRVAAEKRSFKGIDKRQEDRWILILDREEQLSRTMAEIRIKENAIMDHGRRKA